MQSRQAHRAQPSAPAALDAGADGVQAEQRMNEVPNPYNGGT